MKLHDLVYVIDWGKRYSTITKWNSETRSDENLFSIKTEIPKYSDIDYHWKCIYEPNLTLKGTVNKREPKKLKEKIPVYKNYKWEIVEIVTHPDNNKELFLLTSTHTDKLWMKCCILIGAEGVSKLTPEQYADEQFNAVVESNLGKWDRNLLNNLQDTKKIPKEIISVFYDENDNVLFGSSIVKGLVAFHYLDSKFTKDGKCIYLGSEISYDGKGNNACPNKDLIKPFKYIKEYIENN